MKRVIVAVMVALVLFCGVLNAATTRQLTPAETAAITAYISAREANHLNLRAFQRSPLELVREYERYKFDNVKQRWNARPVFPGWQDSCYRWYPNGKYYRDQLYCSKCGAFVNPAGNACTGHQPRDKMQQWQFCNLLIASTYAKPIEAKAHLWNALQHQELTEAQWDILMVQVDALAVQSPARK